MSEKLLTLNEIAEKLRVSRHTVQAWISPSSPNHKPEFANMARHAGRKTVFIENEIETWLNQRKGAIYSQEFIETSAYWKEKFMSARGLFKAQIKAQDFPKMIKKNFGGGKLGLDFEPLMVWLSDSPRASEIYSCVNRAEGLVIAIPMVWWFLKRFARNKKLFVEAKKFFIEDNIFELAPMNEESLKKSFELPITAGDISIQSYACINTAGANSLLTYSQSLLKIQGLSVCSL
ncbi:MAG: helix-turn-helix domain-containing protein [Candidatus Riflebacteria bacterium]|nr:helix-turn-helix domain-containing protein [Candidatus Riflebacteria bacterium]